MKGIGDIILETFRTDKSNLTTSVTPEMAEGLHIPYEELYQMPTEKLVFLHKREKLHYQTKLSVLTLLKTRTEDLHRMEAEARKKEVMKLRPWAYDKHLKKGTLLEPDSHGSLIKVWYVLKNSKKPEGWQKTLYSYDFANEREIFSTHKEQICRNLESRGLDYIKNFHGNGKPLNGYKKLMELVRKYWKDGVLLHMRVYANQIKVQQPNGEFLPMQLQGWSHTNQAGS